MFYSLSVVRRSPDPTAPTPRDRGRCRLSPANGPTLTKKVRRLAGLKAKGTMARPTPVGNVTVRLVCESLDTPVSRHSPRPGDSHGRGFFVPLIMRRRAGTLGRCAGFGMSDFSDPLFPFGNNEIGSKSAQGSMDASAACEQAHDVVRCRLER